MSPALSHLYSELPRLSVSPLPRLFDFSLWERRGARWACDVEGDVSTPFSQIVPSIQVRPPRGTTVRIQMAVGRGKHWTDLLDVGWHGDPRGLPKRRRLRGGGARVDVDYLLTESPARRWRMRLITDAPEPWQLPWGLCAVTWRGAGKHRDWCRVPDLARTVSLRIPRASQMDEGGKDGPTACSPATVQMLLAHRGASHDVPAVMRAAWDPVEEIYGNWQFAVGAAWRLGRPGLLVFFRHWGQVLDCLRAKMPIGASIKFPRGAIDLPGAPIEHSSGHLVVIRGLTPGGEVLVNDPAAKSRDGVPRRYALEPFSRAWFGFSGMGYLIL